MRAGRAFTGILLTLFLARVASLVLHFVLAAPSGARAAQHPLDLIPAALAGEIGTLAALGALAGVLSWISARAGLVFLAAGGVFVLFLSQFDLELVRWTGEYLNARWIGVYDPIGDPKILRDVVTGDARAFAIASLLVLAPSAVLLLLARQGDPPKVSARAVAFCAACAFAGIGAMPLLAPSAPALRRARPGLLGLVAEAFASPGGLSPREMREGLARLDAFLGRPRGWFSAAGYPVWHAAPSEEASYAAFRVRPLERRPDVLLVVLESARGWELDVRRPGVAGRVPELHRLFAERAVAFSAFIATGYPSIEGLGGLFLGIPGHPSKLLLDAARRIRVLSLPDVLKRAGTGASS